MRTHVSGTRLRGLSLSLSLSLSLCLSFFLEARWRVQVLAGDYSDFRPCGAKVRLGRPYPRDPRRSTGEKRQRKGEKRGKRERERERGGGRGRGRKGRRERDKKRPMESRGCYASRLRLRAGGRRTCFGRSHTPLNHAGSSRVKHGFTHA